MRRVLPHSSCRQSDTLYVANAQDGSGRLFQGSDLTPEGRIDLGEDADNVRVDDAHHRVYVGYGSGALAVIDSSSRKKIADIALKAHPESFQIDSSGSRLLVNVPEARQIALVDSAAFKQVATWPTQDLGANFPLALDGPGGKHSRSSATLRCSASFVCLTADCSTR